MRSADGLIDDDADLLSVVRELSHAHAAVAVAAEALGIAPAQCIYLDDLGVNCKGAAQLGMAAIKVGDADAALEALWKLLGTGPKD